MMLPDEFRPRVYLDGYPLENLLQRGIARVVMETVARSCNDIDYTIGTENPLLYEIAGVSFHSCMRDRNQAGEFSRFTRRKKVSWKLSSASSKFDVYQSAFFIPCPELEIHQIQYVYDMIPEQLPDIMGRWGYLESKRKSAAIEQADTLVCISHATRDALLAIHPHLQTRIEVVPLGGEHLCRAREPIATIVHAPYVLFVGHRHAYKNFEVVLRALASTFWPPELRLLVVGRPATIHERLLTAFYGVRARIDWTGYVSDDKLAELYNRASAFVFPSLMEGFGIPVLEAQLNFCPLVASDIPVFREVAGDGAVYFKPTDPDGLANAVIQASNNRSSLIERGSVNAQKFSWNRAATKMIDIYKASFH